MWKEEMKVLEDSFDDLEIVVSWVKVVDEDGEEDGDETAFSDEFFELDVLEGEAVDEEADGGAHARGFEVVCEEFCDEFWGSGREEETYRGLFC